MGLVNQQPRIVPFFHLDETTQVGNVSIHAVDAFDGNEDAGVLPSDCVKQFVQRAPVIVRKCTMHRSRQLGALQNAVVRERIVDNEVTRTGKMTEDGRIGKIAADEHDRVFGSNQVGKLVFEFTVEWPLAGDQATRRHRCSHCIDCLLCSFVHSRMAGQSEIVVAREVE